MKTLLITTPLLAMLLTGCGPDVASSDQIEARRQEVAAKEAQAQTGFPGITNFTEKKIVRKLYELRDQNISTYSYVQDMNGRLFHVCDSIGYGLPYGVQFTNPEKWNYVGNYEGYNLPQPEPNGLFMPPTAEGTWVICAAPKGEFQPVYVEPRVIVSPFKLKAAGEYREK